MIKVAALFVLVAILLTIFLVDAAAAANKKTPPALTERIKHVIVVMVENQALDRVQGHWTPPQLDRVQGHWTPPQSGETFDGVLGKNIFNPISTLDPSKGYVNLSTKARNVCQWDPNHGYSEYQTKLYGLKNILKDHFGGDIVPTNDGFVEQQITGEHCSVQSGGCGVMETYPNGSLPIFDALADIGVSSDRYFCSVPSATWPSRQFFLSATSQGNLDTGAFLVGIPGSLYTSPTILDKVVEAGGTALNVVSDTPWQLSMASIAHHPERIVFLENFLADVRKGKMPDFAWIEPRSGVNLTDYRCSTDFHPRHSATSCQSFLKQVYEAVRASPAWNETLLVVTFDEGGGFHDHVPPPSNVPPPGDGWGDWDDFVDLRPFKFDRLGSRIPFYLISPWVKAGRVLHEPPAAQSPMPGSSQYEHTSTFSTMRKILPLLNKTGPMTKRDEWAGTYEHLFMELDEPRTDYPMKLPEVTFPEDPKRKVTEADRRKIALAEGEDEITDLQHGILENHCRALTGRTPSECRTPKHINKQKHVSPYAQHLFKKHVDKVTEWKAHKEMHKTNTSDIELAVQPDGLPVLAASWRFRYTLKNGTGTKGVPPVRTAGTISTVLNGKRFCVDGGSMKEGEYLSATPCYPSSYPARNRDPSQNFLIRGDATIGPTVDPSLCLTNHLSQNPFDVRVKLEKCANNNVAQLYGYHGRENEAGPGTYQGEGGSGAIYYGDDTNRLAIRKKVKL